MYYNFHNEKYSIGSIGGIHKEQFREYQNPDGYKNRVDTERTHLNLYKEMSHEGTDWKKRVRQAVEETRQTTGRKVRSNTVVICSTIETVPKSWPPDTCKEYFQEKADWFQGYLTENAGVSKDCMLSIAVHLDEDSPHCTYAWIPMKDGKLQAKNIVNQSFLKSMMADSEKFTFTWIDQYNLSHSESLEKMEPHVEGGRKKRLQEDEYKIQKASEKMEYLEARHEELEQKVSDTKRQHQEVSEDLGAAKAELQKTHADTAEALVAGKLAEQKIQESKIREQDIEQREKRITELTNSPSLAAYQEVRDENQNLKKQISIKDKIIESLQEQNQKLQHTISSWKEKISHLGRRMVHALGFRDDELNADSTQQMNEFPSREVSEAYSSAIGVIQEIDPRSLRIIPDPEHDDCFALAVKEKNGKYKIKENDFATRELADQRRKELTQAKIELNRNYKKSLEKHLTK